MPIGPNGEMLPYNGGMGGNPGPDLPPMGGVGPDLPLPGMGVADIPPQGGDEMAARQRLMQIAAEAEAILSQFPNLAGELMGEGGVGGAAVGGVGGMPEMPVAANTDALGGGLLGGVA